VSDLALLFGRMLLIGIAIAAPVGAMAVLTIGRTAERGWRAGLATGAGIATADALFAAVAAFGISAVSNWLIEFQDPLRAIGGAGLVWLGWRALANGSRVRAGVEAEASTPDPGGNSATHVGRLYASATALTLTNPMTIIVFAAVFASAGMAAQSSLAAAVVVTLGIALGSLLWWSALVLAVWALRHALSARATAIINLGSGGLLVLLGVIAMVTGAIGIVSATRL